MKADRTTIAAAMLALALCTLAPAGARADTQPAPSESPPAATPAPVAPRSGASSTPAEVPSGATATPVTPSEVAPTPTPSPPPPVPWSRAWGEYARLDPAVANQARLVDVVREGVRPERILRVQVLLDRAHYSVGEIDAVYGHHTREAVAALQAVRRRPTTGVVDEHVWADLHADAAPILTTYVVTARDLDGPFTRVPREMAQKARLATLGYASVQEALGERFHASPELLARLNPDATFRQPGETLVVPNVTRSPLPHPAAVVVNGTQRSVSALDAAGRVLARYPATVGSVHDPLPVGNWTILSRTLNPAFYYNPRLFWDAKPSDHAVRIAPGPNNPVGVVWIELSKEHYAIHGTPEPKMISRTASHGCIRLTNWDAAELAAAIEPGTPALLRR